MYTKYLQFEKCFSDWDGFS